MQVLHKIKSALNLTGYGIAKAINRLGVSVTISGVDAYLANKKVKSMRLDILCAVRRLSGMSWEKFGQDLDAEYLPTQLPEDRNAQDQDQSQTSKAKRKR